MARLGTALMAIVLLVAGCGGGDSKDDASGPAPSRVASTPSPTPTPTPPELPKDCPKISTKVELTTVNASWADEEGHPFKTGQACIVVPAGERFTVTVANNPKGKGLADANHNFAIYPGLGVADGLFNGDLVYDGESVTYRPPALDKGRYLFQCDIHPSTMYGVIDVK